VPLSLTTPIETPDDRQCKAMGDASHGDFGIKPGSAGGEMIKVDFTL
jgi:hypothetical protein